MRPGWLALVLALAGCATQAPHFQPAPPPPPSRLNPPALSPAPETLVPTSFDALPGWRDEDHAAALAPSPPPATLHSSLPFIGRANDA